MKITIQILSFLILSSLFLCCKGKTKGDEVDPHEFEKALISEWNQITVYNDLKNYIITHSVENYKVKASFFDKATIENTDLLREMVHHSNYKNKAEGRRPKKERRAELGYMFKGQGVGENCGFMSTTLFDMYRALGFKVKRYDVIDGSLKGFLKYRDSHVFVEVYIPRLKKYIIQDPTINNSVLSCEYQKRLSLKKSEKACI